MPVWCLRRHLFLSGVFALIVGLGCQAADRPSLAGLTPDFASMMTLPGCETPAQARAQNPSGTSSILEAGPDSKSNNSSRTARIRAVVNGEAILEEEVVAAAYQGLLQARTEAEKAEVLNQKLTEIIERELLIQDATIRLSKGGRTRFLKELERIADREFDRQYLARLMRANNQTDLVAFTRVLRDQNVPIDMIRRQWVRNFIAMEYARSRIEVNLNKIGHLQIAEYYEQHNDEFKVDDSIVWQDMFIANARHPSPAAARQFAEVLAGRIRKGEDFARLAKEYDNGDSSFRQNAEGIGTKRGEIKPREAEDVLFNLRPGEVAPLIEIDTGYHIVKLVKRTYAGKMPFDDKVQKEIRDKLRGQIYQQEMRRVINDLKRRAIIEIAKQVP